MFNILSKLKNIFKVLIPILLLAFLLRNVVTNWAQFENYLLNLDVLPLILSFMVMLIIYPEAAFSWYLLIRNDKIKLAKATRVWVISISSRYIPGTLWQYLGRIELAKSDLNISRKKTIISLIQEIFLSVLAACFVSLFALEFIIPSTQIKYLLFFFLVAGGVMLIPFVSGKILKILLKITKRKVDGEFAVSNNVNLLLPLPFFVFNFILNGLGLLLIQYAFLHNMDLNLLTISGIYAFSWLIGYFTLIAPGGLGVTEVSLAYFLSIYAQIPLSVASGIALVFRFVLTLAEMAVFLFLLSYKPKDANENN